MATRLKTIEYAFQTNIVSLGSATRRDMTAITIHIPEASGTITFRSVAVEVMCAADNTGTAATLTLPVIGIKLGAVAFDNLTLTNPYPNSTESECWKFCRDVTSYFIANWTGTQMTCQVGFQFTGLSTQNHSAKVYVTYEYDDTQPIQIKTVRIPIESTRTTLTASYQTIGGATAIPALKGAYLPEIGQTPIQTWIELWGNEVTNSNVDFTVSARINGATTFTWWDSESGLQSDRWAYGIWDLTAQTLTSAVSLEALSTTTGRMGNIGGMVCHTYEFNATGSTTIYNSLILGAVDTAGWVGGTSLADGGSWQMNVYIEEPTTLTLKESAVCVFFNDTVGFNLSVGVGPQSASTTTYTATSGIVNCGQFSLVHRFDGGGTNTTPGITLARGKNDYNIHFFSNTVEAGWQLNGFTILNYTSSKHPNGVGAHNHSCYRLIGNSVSGATSVFDTVQPIFIPETNYRITGFLNYLPATIAASTTFSYTLAAQLLPGEINGDGWEQIFVTTSRSDNENSIQTLYLTTRSSWKRWTGDPDTNRMSPLTSRKFRTDTNLGSHKALGIWYTYHTISYIISGTCSNYSGDGSGIIVDIYSVENDEKVLSTTTTSGGVFSTTWYDNTEQLYAAARQDDTHVGRSTDGLAG